MQQSNGPVSTLSLIIGLFVLAACSAEEGHVEDDSTANVMSEPAIEEIGPGQVVGYIDENGNFVAGEPPATNSSSGGSAYSMSSGGSSAGYGYDTPTVNSVEEARALGPGKYVDREGREIIIEPSIAKPEAEYSDGDPYAMPVFPWPPERPSSQMRLERRGFLARDAMSLSDIEDILSLSLMDAGYFEQSFYSVPGGFALVTRLEGIDSEGVPLGAELRYLQSDEERPFSLTEFVGSLFFAPEGYYRFVTFIISDRPFMTSDSELTESSAQARLQGGTNALPADYDEVLFTPAHNIDALIYEYRKSAAIDQPELVVPGRLSPQTHMLNSGVATALANTLLSVDGQ